MDYTFYVVIRNSDGKFWKKSRSDYSYREHRLNKDVSKSDGFFTNKLGRARIFESYEVAKKSLPSWDIYEHKEQTIDSPFAFRKIGEESWLDLGQVSIIKMVAVKDEENE